MDFHHISILLDEVIEGLNIKEDGIYVDGTLGGGGHSLEIVKRLKNGKLIGIDQDENALIKSREVLKEYMDKVEIVHNNYENIDVILQDLNIDKVDGIFLDLGVSSHHFDEGNRGFSYNKDAPLDMRMNKDDEISAWNVVNEYSQRELEEILWNYGEERWSKRIAEFIVIERENHTIDTTFELLDVIKKAIPKKVRMEGPHPGRKTFQGIRIEVNRELEVLENSIEKMVELLKPGGRLVIISFHSLEDRIVKDTFKYLFKRCTCPPEFPQCICDKERTIEIITRRPIVPSEQEIKDNKRSRSAKLRIAEKL